MGFMAPCFTDLPAVFVSVSYRLLPQVRFPVHLDDIIAALAWVHRNIARYGGNPERLFIGGHSPRRHSAHPPLPAPGPPPGPRVPAAPRPPPPSAGPPPAFHTPPSH